MHKREKRLQPIKDLAGMRERNQASALGEAERRYGEAELRLQELLRYRQEYERTFQQTATAGAPMRGLREQQIFIARLTAAVRAQEQLVEQIKIECTVVRAQWRDAATRKRVVGKVIERAKAEEIMKEDRRQQMDNDERVMHTRVPR